MMQDNKDLEEHGCKLCPRNNNKTFQKQTRRVTKSIEYNTKGYMKTYNDILVIIKNKKEFTVFDIIQNIKEYTDAEKQLKVLKLLVCEGKLSCKYKLGNPIYKIIKDNERCRFLKLYEEENGNKYLECINEEWIKYTKSEIEYIKEKLESENRDLFVQSWQKKMHVYYTNSINWKTTIRTRVMFETKGNCIGKGCKKAAEQVHHINYEHWNTEEINSFINKRSKPFKIIKKIGGTKLVDKLMDLDLAQSKDNLQPLCRECHKKKHNIVSDEINNVDDAIETSSSLLTFIS